MFARELARLPRKREAVRLRPRARIADARVSVLSRARFAMIIYKTRHSSHTDCRKRRGAEHT